MEDTADATQEFDIILALHHDKDLWPWSGTEAVPQASEMSSDVCETPPKARAVKTERVREVILAHLLKEGWILHGLASIAQFAGGIGPVFWLVGIRHQHSVKISAQS